MRLNTPDQLIMQPDQSSPAVHDPAGGVIERDAAGNPTGFLKDPPAIALALRAIPRPSAEERLGLLEQAQAMHSRHGVTTIFEPKAGEEELA